MSEFQNKLKMSLAIVRALQCRNRLVGQAVSLTKLYRLKFSLYFTISRLVCITFFLFRFACFLFSTDNSDNKNETIKGGELTKLEKYSRKNVRKNVEGYLFPRFFDYVSNYDKVLEKNFPQAMQVYRIFMMGVKDFFRDMKSYLKCSKIVNNTTKGLSALTRKEIELYYQMPKDMMRVAPVLLISALPFANYVIFPLAFYFPRKLLTSHFWSLEQKVNFQQLTIKERISHNRRIFRFLQAKRDQIKEKPHYLELKQVLAHLGSGTHPTPQEIIAVMEVFARPPYHLNFLTSAHLVSLFYPWLFPLIWNLTFFLKIQIPEITLSSSWDPQSLVEASEVVRASLHSPADGFCHQTGRGCPQYADRGTEESLFHSRDQRAKFEQSGNDWLAPCMGQSVLSFIESTL